MIADPVERRQAIAELADSAKTTAMLIFRGSPTQCKLINIPIDYLAYRINNGRTRVEQLRYVAEHRKPKDFFATSDDTEDTQRAQGSILLDMSKDQKGDVFSELARVAVQTEPFLITADGVLVNGNRRVAAMRELLRTEPLKYQNFKHVETIVLPDKANEEDIEDVETELQETPETKLDYGWIARRLKLQYQTQILKKKPKELRDRYRLAKDEDITKELLQLKLAEDYLEYIGKPRDSYWDLAKSEEIFRQLQNAISKSAPDQIEAKKWLGFGLIKRGQADLIAERLYKYHPMFGAKMEAVLERATTDGTLPAFASDGVSAIPSPQDDSGDPLSAIAGVRPRLRSKVDKFTAALKSPEASEVVSAMIDAFDSMEREKKQGDERTLTLRNVTTANKLLQDIDIAKMDPSGIDIVAAQLRSIASRTAKLLGELKL